MPPPPEVAQFATSVVGMTLEQAEAYIRDVGALLGGLRSRLTRVNGRPCIVTRDYRTDRINLTVVDNVVTAADVG